MHFDRMKKIFALLAAAITISVLYLSPLQAQSSAAMERYLAQIAQNTYNTLQAVNNVPVYLANLPILIDNWIAHYDSKVTSQLQADLTTYGNKVVQAMNTQTSLQPQLLPELFGKDVTPSTLPNANDLTYSTLLGMPYFDPDPRNAPGEPPAVNPPFNYLANAAGIKLSHAMPSLSWSGKSDAQLRYINYYNTVMSVESFNGYALSTLYADYINNGGPLTTLQASLITQATNAKDWFVEIDSEPLGKVLRQLLLYESQVFVLLHQLVETEKQLLAAQVMSNSLLIANNQSNEELLVQKAKGGPLTL